MTSTCLLNLNEKAQRSRRNFVGREQQNMKFGRKRILKSQVWKQAASSDAEIKKLSPGAVG